MRRLIPWGLCVAAPYFPLPLLALEGPLPLLLTAAAQMGAVLGLEGAYSRFRLRAGAADLRRRFYRAAVWALAALPCRLLVPALSPGGALALWGAACVLVCRRLRPATQ